MPLVYERTFQVRHYECDAYGRLHHANLARFMQETAVAASANVGYDIARYEAMKRQWLIRESRLTVLRPLTFDDVLIVKTWVHDFRRVRSQRAYEFRLAENNELLAQAFTDWIFVDTESERPTAVPNEMILAFRPEELPAQAPRREKFPQPPTAPVQVFNMQRPVFWHDIDEAGHLNNAAYLTFLEDCNIQVAAHFGWPPARFQENEFGIFAAHYQIEYLQPAFLNDTLELTSYLSDVAETTAVRHYLFKRISDNIPLARAKLQWHCRAYPSQKIVPIPPQLLVDFKPNLAEK